MSERLRIRNQRIDRAAGWFITVGGVAIIVSVVLILILIIQVALPLFKRSTAEMVARFALPEDIKAYETLAIGMDEYLETVFVVTRDGAFSFLDAHTGALVARNTVEPPAPGRVLQSAEAFGNLEYCLLWDDGTVTLAEVRVTPTFEGGVRKDLEHDLKILAGHALDAGAAIPLKTVARATDGGGLTRIDLFTENRITVTQQVTKKDIFGREKSDASTSTITDALPGDISALTVDTAGVTLYAGTHNGYLLRWDLSTAGAPVLTDRFKAFTDERPITALTMVFGDVSIAVGDGRGGLSTWTPTSDGQGRKVLTRLHTLRGHAGAVEVIVPSLRNKSLLSLDAHGTVHLDHMTSEKALLALRTESPFVHVAMSARGNGIAGFDLAGQASTWALDNPHPEASFGTLFKKVWYEGYDKPEYVWQSSASTDDHEPKMSLMPLVFGSFKGTFYAMLYAVPLALFGAVYTSQFTTHGFRKFIKPTVEIMAAIPSVVIGFLVALWLAPVVERLIVPVLVSIIVVPVVFLTFIVAWQPLRRFTLAKRLETGYEFLVLFPVLIVGFVAAYGAGRFLEPVLFGGDFRLWLFQETGTRYDQRNAIIIAFGLGFAVIPIIFTIAEDALSSVPHTLKAGSLALGASRWQTVWRVVLPSASPGIFAGIMIGFGRAVGETMIVLMATGNTPIMDWSPFNGMRTLSANIAVEIPEAPVGGTLYRILFLSAVLLFLLTSVLNTAAELVRQRLRRKYGQFNA